MNNTHIAKHGPCVVDVVQVPPFQRLEHRLTPAILKHVATAQRDDSLRMTPLDSTSQ
jgi:hypothetical protein